MAVIQISNLTFGYDGSRENIFEDLSFQIEDTWNLGLIGRNGKGKTTLLSLLAGRYPYSGTISGNRAFSYFPYQISSPNRMVACLAEELLPECPKWKIEKEFSSIGLDENCYFRDFSTLSKGEQSKVLLSFLFLKEDRFLLIDEPTNHLDAASRKTVADYLNRKTGFILVSHDRLFLDSCVDHILALNRDGIEIQKGNFSSWYENKRRLDEFEIGENEKLKKQIKKLDASARQSSDWSNKSEKTKKGTRNSGLRPDTGYIGHKAAKMMKRAKNIEKRKNEAVEKKRELLKNIEMVETLALSPLTFHSQRLIEVRDLSVSFGEKKIFDHLSFTLEQGEKIALCGKNGCGKSTVLKLLCGENISFSGKLDMPNLTVSYLPQDFSFLRGAIQEYIFRSGIDKTLFLAILRKLDFARSDFEKDLETLSEGQKKKILIATSLCRKAHLYIWDEPLNYIDIFSRIQLEELLSATDASMVFVEHDLSFVRNIADKMIEFH